MGARQVPVPASKAQPDGRRRVVIDAVRPCLDGGRTAIKRVVGDQVRVEADARYLWNGGRAFVALDPLIMPAHVFRVRHHVRSEHAFEYYL